MKLILALLYLLTLTTYAIDVFDERGHLSEDYSELDFSEGEVPEDRMLTLNDQKSFEYIELLGQGNTTTIHRVRDAKTGAEYALRLPLENDRYIQYTNKVYPTLEKYGVAIPKRYSSLDSLYVLAQVIEIEFDLTHFLENYKTLKISDRNKEEAIQKLLIFFKESAMFEEISDFHTGQVAYSKKDGWVLLDWTNKTELFSSKKSTHLLSDGRYVFADLQEYQENDDISSLIDRISDVIKNERHDLLIKDESSFNELIKGIDRDTLIKGLSHLWYSRDYLTKFKKLILDISASDFKKMNFSVADIELFKKGLNLNNHEAQPMVEIQFELATSKKEVMSLLEKDDSILSFTKSEIIELYSEKLKLIGFSTQELQLLISRYKGSNCFNSLNSF